MQTKRETAVLGSLTLTIDSVCGLIVSSTRFTLSLGASTKRKLARQVV